MRQRTHLAIRSSLTLLNWERNSLKRVNTWPKNSSDRTNMLFANIWILKIELIVYTSYQKTFWFCLQIQYESRCFCLLKFCVCFVFKNRHSEPLRVYFRQFNFLGCKYVESLLIAIMMVFHVWLSCLVEEGEFCSRLNLKTSLPQLWENESTLVRKRIMLILDKTIAEKRGLILMLIYFIYAVYFSKGLQGFFRHHLIDFFNTSVK